MNNSKLGVCKFVATPTWGTICEIFPFGNNPSAIYTRPKSETYFIYIVTSSYGLQIKRATCPRTRFNFLFPVVKLNSRSGQLIKSQPLEASNVKVKVKLSRGKSRFGSYQFSPPYKNFVLEIYKKKNGGDRVSKYQWCLTTPLTSGCFFAFCFTLSQLLLLTQTLSWLLLNIPLTL